MTEQEKQSIVEAVLSAVRTNSRTIGQLTPVSSLSENDYFEVAGGKKVSLGTLSGQIMTDIPLDTLDGRYRVSIAQEQTPIITTGKLIYEDGASTIGNIDAPDPSSLASVFEVWFFPVQAGQVWHLANTHPNGQNTGAAVFAIYGGETTLTTADCNHDNAILVSGRLSTAVDTDTSISIAYNPQSLVVSSPLAIPEGAQWLALTRYKPSVNPDVITVKKSVYLTPNEAFDAKADLVGGVLKSEEIPFDALDPRYMVGIGVGKTADHVVQAKSIGYYGDTACEITDVTGIGDRFELWYFQVQAGEEWRIINTHPSEASLGSAAYAIYGGETPIAYTECARSNALWGSTKLVSAFDTNVDLKAPTGNAGYNPYNLGLTPPLTMPQGAQWLVLTNYKYGSTKDVITVEKKERITPTEAMTTLPLKVKRDGENVLVCYNDGGTEILYQFGRCFNSGEAVNNTLGLAEVGYRYVNRPFPMATGTANMLCHQHYSDMIGPVKIGDEFVGGAHNYDGAPTASTENDAWASIQADGKTVADGDDIYCHNVQLSVVNRVKCVDSNALVDCYEETITMTVEGASVRVRVKHEYKYSGGVGKTISLYYGMQSMFGARATTQILTPDGMFPELIAETSASSFTKGEYPNFNRFIQRNPNGWCQSAWVNPAVGIGDHSWIYDGTAIFVDGNANKFYHRLISTKTITEGLTYEWEGVYQWAEDIPTPIDFDMANQGESGGGGGDMSNYYTKSQTNTLLADKQDTLVSGTNIKTINNGSLLGSGNLSLATQEALSNYCPIIEDTRSSAVAAITGVAPFASLVDGQRILLKLKYNAGDNTSTTLNLTLSDGTSTTGAIDVYGGASTMSTLTKQISVKAGMYIPLIYDQTNSRWVYLSQKDNNTTYTTISQAEIDAGTNTNQRVITPKLLCDNFDKVTTLVEVSSTGDVTQALDSGKFYRFGEVDSLTLTFTAPSAGMGIWGGKFTASASWSALGIPATIDEAAGNDSVAGGKSYEFNMVDNVIVIKEV